MQESLTQVQQEWVDRVVRWKASTLERDEFAAKEGVTGKRLRWWYWKLRKLGVLSSEEEKPKATAPSFVRLEVGVPSSEVERTEPLEIVLSGGQRVRIPVGFDASTLARLMAVLGGGAAA